MSSSGALHASGGFILKMALVESEESYLDKHTSGNRVTRICVMWGIGVVNNLHNWTAPEQSKMGTTLHCISSSTVQAKRCLKTDKKFYGFKFWIGYSYSKIKGYVFIVLLRIHFLGPNIWFLESNFWNALEQQQNEKLPEQFWYWKSRSASHHTSKKKQGSAALVRSSVGKWFCHLCNLNQICKPTSHWNILRVGTPIKEFASAVVWLAFFASIWSQAMPI